MSPQRASAIFPGGESLKLTDYGPFIHKPFSNPKSIRLVRLISNPEDCIVEYRPFEADFERGGICDYVVLSYIWKTDNKPKKTNQHLINYSVFEISPNLCGFLQIIALCMAVKCCGTTRYTSHQIARICNQISSSIMTASFAFYPNLVTISMSSPNLGTALTDMITMRSGDNSTSDCTRSCTATYSTLVWSRCDFIYREIQVRTDYFPKLTYS